MQVNIHNTSFAVLLSDRFQLSDNFDYHPFVGATPDFGLPRNFDNVTVALTGSQSTKTGYKSSFDFACLNWRIDQKRTTLNAGHGYITDDISSISTNNIGSNHITQNPQFYFTQITERKGVTYQSLQANAYST